MKRARNSAIHSIRAPAVTICLCMLLSDASAQPAVDGLGTKPLDICVQSLTNARQRVDALSRQIQSCRAEPAGGESIERLQRERDGAVRALALALQMRVGLPQGCGDTTIDIRFIDSRPAVEVRGTAREPTDAARRIDDAIRDLGLDRTSIDMRPGDTCGRRLFGGYVVLTVEPREEKPTANDVERLPDVVACEDVGHMLVEAKLAPLRFWVRTPSGQLAHCFRQGNGTFIWSDINLSEPALVIQRGAQ